MPYSTRISTLDIQEENSLFADIPDVSTFENHTTFKKLGYMNSPNIQKLKELFGADLGTNSDDQIAFEIFYNHLLAGDYDELNLDEFPLNIELSKVSVAKATNIKKVESLKELISSNVTYTLSEFIEIEEEYLDTLISKIFKLQFV